MIELFLSLGILIAAIGSGRHLLQRILGGASLETGGASLDGGEEIVFSAALGFGLLICGVFLLGIVGWLYGGAVWALVVFWGILGVHGVYRWWWHPGVALLGLRHGFRRPEAWVAVATCLLLLLLLLRALAPPHGATDPLAYQLALPKLFLLTHRLGFEATLTGALYPSNMGLLYVVCLALRNGIVAQVLHWSMAVLTCVGIFASTRHLSCWRAGVWAAAVFAAMPIVVIIAPQAYIDGGLCFFQFVALWALARWLETPSRRGLILAAILTGLALGTKHQALATLVIAVPAIGVRRLWGARDVAAALRDMVTFTAVAGVLVAPWYARAWWLAGNPVWPLANGFFGGAPFGQHGATASAQGAPGGAPSWRAWLPSLEWFQMYGVSMNPWNWTFEPRGWQKAIGVYFVALLPGALLLPRRRPILLLAGFCLVYYVLLVRFLDMNPRYGLVLFAFASVLVGLTAQRLVDASLPPVRYAFLAGAALTGVCNLAWGYALARPLLPVVVGLESSDVFLSRAEPTYRLFRFVNENTPRTSRILLQGIVKGYYCDRPYLWDHPLQGVVRYSDFEGPAALRGRLRELGITHVARMIRLPGGRLQLGYPQYFVDPFHEAFRQRYLELIYRDERFVLFHLREAPVAVPAKGGA